jgi:hypothetical protein
LFLYLPDITSASSVTFSARYDTEAQLLASLRGSSRVKVDTKLEALSQRLESLRHLSSRLTGIEEIVGEINDEFDEVEADYKKISENVYLFEAKTSLNDFCRVFEVEAAYFEKAKGESESLAGLIIELFGRIPSAGEDLEFEDFNFKVQSVDTRRIKKVRVTHRPAADQDDSQN